MSIRRSQGFTLIEAMVVLVIVGAVAAISLDMLTGAAKAEARRQMVSQQATEMATLNRAVTEWVRTATGLPTNTGDILEVDLQRVIDAGALPSEFARRPASGSTAPISPLGQHYRAFIRRTAGRTYEIAVMPLGTPRPGFAARAGVSNEPESLRVFNIGVMQEIRSRFTLPAGVINQGTASIDSAASGFTLDLSAFLGGNAADMTIAALSNFAELAMFTEAAPSDQAQSFVGRTCRFVTSPQTCSTGERIAVEHTMCARTGLDFLETSATSELTITPIGNLQISRINTFNSIGLYGNHLATAIGIHRYAEHIGGDQCRHTFSGRIYTCPGGNWWGQTFGFASAADLNTSGQRAYQNPLTLWNPISTYRELGTWSLHLTGTFTRGPDKPTCGGANTAPAPTWTGTMVFNRIEAAPSINEVPVEILSLTRPTAGLGIVFASQHEERVQITGGGVITSMCEMNQLVGAHAAFDIGQVEGSGSSVIAINSCPLRNPPTDFQMFHGRAPERPIERGRARVLPQNMRVVRICCS